MKKIMMIIICLFLCSCGNEKKTTIDTIEIDTINVTSDTILFQVNSELTDLKYKLLLDNEEIVCGVVKGDIKLVDLKKDTEYELEVYNNETKTTQKITTDDTVILRFGGDTTISDLFGTYTETNGINYMWDDISELTNSADYMVVNLETAVSEQGETTKPEGYGFRSNPKYLQGYVNAGVDMVLLANNHVKDYGALAFNDTLTNLDKYKIKHIGAGLDYEAASTVTYITVNGVKLGFFDATSIIPNNGWVATESNGGVMPLKDTYYDKIYAILKVADTKCDMLLVFLHWGVEYTNVPTASQITLAHRLIDEGVDVIIGGHPHVLQGIEYYNTKQIFYSVGNFIFYKNNDDSGLTGLFEIEIDNEKIISSKVYPIYISAGKANLLSSGNNKYSEIINNLNDRSSSLNAIISSQGIISEE